MPQQQCMFVSELHMIQQQCMFVSELHMIHQQCMFVSEHHMTQQQCMFVSELHMTQQQCMFVSKLHMIQQQCILWLSITHLQNTDWDGPQRVSFYRHTSGEKLDNECHVCKNNPMQNTWSGRRRCGHQSCKVDTPHAECRKHCCVNRTCLSSSAHKTDKSSHDIQTICPLSFLKHAAYQITTAYTTWKTSQCISSFQMWIFLTLMWNWRWCGLTRTLF